MKFSKIVIEMGIKKIDNLPNLATPLRISRITILMLPCVNLGKLKSWKEIISIWVWLSSLSVNLAESTLKS